MEVHEGSIEDIPEVNWMMSEFLQTTPYGQYYSEQYGSKFLHSLLSNPQTLLLVVKRDKHSVGMLAAVTSMSPFVPIRTATDLGWWIQPEYRGGIAGISMIKKYEEWALKQGCSVINMFSLADPKVNNVYKRLGYTEAEHGWSKFVCPSQHLQLSQPLVQPLL